MQIKIDTLYTIIAIAVTLAMISFVVVQLEIYRVLHGVDETIKESQRIQTEIRQELKEYRELNDIGLNYRI